MDQLLLTTPIYSTTTACWTGSGNWRGAAIVAVTLTGGVAGRSTLFAAAFAVLFLLLAGRYALAGRDQRSRELCRWYVAGSLTGSAGWAASLLLPAPGRYWVWGVALVGNAAISGPVAYAFMRQPPRQVSHMPERFGLFTIVVLGEAVLAVVNGIAVTNWNAGG